MSEQNPSEQSEGANANSVQRLVRPSDHSCDWWPTPVYFGFWHWLRIIRIRLFYGFLHLTVSCYGGVYILKAAIVAAHLFEHLKFLKCRHDRFCVWCGVWLPNAEVSDGGVKTQECTESHNRRSLH